MMTPSCFRITFPDVWPAAEGLLGSWDVSPPFRSLRLPRLRALVGSVTWLSRQSGKNAER
jgi:hypothetical protein